jgi:hypothetical protein
MLRNTLRVTGWTPFAAGIYAAFALCILSALDDMTRADCARGNQRACAAVEAKR